MYQQQIQPKHSHSDLEEFKKNWKQRIQNISKSKTAWVEDFNKEQTNKPQFKIKKYAKDKT